MINDNIALTGALTIAINNEVVQETNNLVVTAGKKWVADRMKGTNAAMSHMAIGTGTTEALAAQTALVTELDRNALTTSGGTVADNVITYECTWAAADGTGAITEAGIFDAASSGDMLARTKFDVVNKGADDSMTITWTITVS
tara:strand:+ start:258 stop:686 length:429 start_codon:yes stop_codon:yes gene_type:complete